MSATISGTASIRASKRPIWPINNNPLPPDQIPAGHVQLFLIDRRRPNLRDYFAQGPSCELCGQAIDTADQIDNPTED